MKYALIVLGSSLLSGVAHAHGVARQDEHTSYAADLFRWPPGTRQLHYYAEILIGALIVAMIIISMLRKLKERKQKNNT